MNTSFDLSGLDFPKANEYPSQQHPFQFGPNSPYMNNMMRASPFCQPHIGNQPFRGRQNPSYYGHYSIPKMYSGQDQGFINSKYISNFDKNQAEEQAFNKWMMEYHHNQQAEQCYLESPFQYKNENFNSFDQINNSFRRQKSMNNASQRAKYQSGMSLKQNFQNQQVHCQNYPNNMHEEQEEDQQIQQQLLNNVVLKPKGKRGRKRKEEILINLKEEAQEETEKIKHTSQMENSQKETSHETYIEIHKKQHDPKLNSMEAEPESIELSYQSFQQPKRKSNRLSLKEDKLKSKEGSIEEEKKSEKSLRSDSNKSMASCTMILSEGKEKQHKSQPKRNLIQQMKEQRSKILQEKNFTSKAHDGKKKFKKNTEEPSLQQKVNRENQSRDLSLKLEDTPKNKQQVESAIHFSTVNKSKNNYNSDLETSSKKYIKRTPTSSKAAKNISKQEQKILKVNPLSDTQKVTPLMNQQKVSMLRQFDKQLKSKSQEKLISSHNSEEKDKELDQEYYKLLREAEYMGRVYSLIGQRVNELVNQIKIQYLFNKNIYPLQNKSQFKYQKKIFKDQVRSDRFFQDLEKGFNQSQEMRESLMQSKNTKQSLRQRQKK